MNQVSDLREFEPGVYITIDDVMSGVRKLAKVTSSGKSYIDLDSEDETPFPIYATLNPVEAGNILGWGLHIVDQNPELHQAWKELCERLINSGEGVLVYNRAAYWAFRNLDMDFDKALLHARKETDAITKGRNKLNAMLNASEGAV